MIVVSVHEHKGAWIRFEITPAQTRVSGSFFLQPDFQHSG